MTKFNEIVRSILFLFLLTSLYCDAQQNDHSSRIFSISVLGGADLTFDTAKSKLTVDIPINEIFYQDIKNNKRLKKKYGIDGSEDYYGFELITCDTKSSVFAYCKDSIYLVKSDTIKENCIGYGDINIAGISKSNEHVSYLIPLDSADSFSNKRLLYTSISSAEIDSSQELIRIFLNEGNSKVFTIAFYNNISKKWNLTSYYEFGEEFGGSDDILMDFCGINKVFYLRSGNDSVLCFVFDSSYRTTASYSLFMIFDYKNPPTEEVTYLTWMDKMSTNLNED